MAHPEPTASSTEAGDSRPASVWPESQQLPAALASSQFAPSRFDPLHDERRRARQRVASHFDLCRAGLALRVVLSVQAGVALAAMVATPTLAGWLAHGAVAAFVALAGTLLWLSALCVLRAWLPHAPVPLQWGLVAALGATAALAGWAVVVPLGLSDGGPWRAASVAAAGTGAGLVLWAWLWLRARAAAPVEAGARLAELQSRIRPHFLFNALNTALALVRADPGRAERVLEDLAQLFRFALAESGSAVTLDQEVDLARRYLAIEQVRFGSRMELVWELDPQAASARVPPLVLQPLVENAVRHGIEPSLRGGRIFVHTQAQRGMAIIWVTNTVAEGEAHVHLPGSGMALGNVRERLRLLHDVAGGLEVWREPGLFHARITVPA